MSTWKAWNTSPKRCEASDDIEESSSKRICLELAEPSQHTKLKPYFGENDQQNISPTRPLLDNWIGNSDGDPQFKDASTLENTDGPQNDSSSHLLQADSVSPGGSSSTCYDTCFGTILATALSSFKGDKRCKKKLVTIDPIDGVLKLTFKDTGKYAGLVRSDALARLLREFSIQITATLNAPTIEKSKHIATKQKTSFPEECVVRIVLFGSMVDAEALGDSFDKSDVFLQHPSPEEIGKGMSYYNPHYLLRPGTEMPSVECLSLKESTEEDNTDRVLDDYNKARFMRLFDDTAGNPSDGQISPSCRLTTTLNRHQLIALAWMASMENTIIDDHKFSSMWKPWQDANSNIQYRNKITGLSERSPRKFRGGILADEMGLGKTLSILALICWSLDLPAKSIGSGIKRANRPQTTLIITPKSTIHNWVGQCKRHVRQGELIWSVHHGPNREKRLEELEKFDIILTTYEITRRDCAEKGPLHSGKWSRLVLDEAHHIRSRSSQTFKAACEINALSRWCLTGTPIHNSLDDFGALISFIGVPKFMEKKEFDFWISNPTKTDHPDSLRRLGLLIKATCLRRTKKSIDLPTKLPGKRETISWVNLTSSDRELYEFFEKKAAAVAQGLDRRGVGPSTTPARKEANILSLINFLRLICNGGEKLLPESARKAWQVRDVDSIVWGPTQSTGTRCELCDSTVTGLDSGFSCLHVICQTCQDDQEIIEIDNELECPKCAISKQDSTNDFQMEIMDHDQVPAKLSALINNLVQEQTVTDDKQERAIKSVVFSSWTKMLDLTQQALEASGFNIQRIDGQTTLERRRKALEKFNEDPRCTVLLASIGSSGEGIDLTVANNVHLLEPHWNPMAEAQAIDRTHRIGQSRDVLVTRYLTRNSIETYVQWIQQDKIRLIERSLDSSTSYSIAVDQRWKRLRQSLGCHEAH